jgi:hypothetical protein
MAARLEKLRRFVAAILFSQAAAFLGDDMTDEQLEEAAEAYECSPEAIPFNQTRYGGYVYESTEVRKAYLAGAAYQLERMRCGGCKYVHSSKYGPLSCQCGDSPMYDEYVAEDFGCIHFEAKEG